MNRFPAIFICTLVTASALPAAAQTTYRWTDPSTGRTIVSDQPPPPGIKAPVTRRTTSGEAGSSELPPALREVVQKFPVTLYVTRDCKDFCEQGRSLLRARGIPFSEKLIGSEEAAIALKQLAGEFGIPTLMVGRQATIGFELNGWSQVLDLAGYPQRPVAGYRVPATAAPPAAAPASSGEAAQ